ncbi:BRCT domain-containing protein, partial [Streptomyces sp. NPDC023588]|uniref:BRCT domain-containing protein n=1 Tax=Streptomyces sp. NPDC023588 TaxID=3154907 RepID=UPI0033F3DE1A
PCTASAIRMSPFWVLTKRTTLLVAGEKAGSKRTKAEELGIRVLDPEEFSALVADLLPTA